jgi:heme oxygenase
MDCRANARNDRPTYLGLGWLSKGGQGSGLQWRAFLLSVCSKKLNNEPLNDRANAGLADWLRGFFKRA